jgi:RND family efflux transporter MFP subunit
MCVNPAPRHSILLVVVLFVELCFSATGCVKTSEQAAPPPPPRVTVAHPVVRELVDEEDFNGWLRSSETVEVRSRVRGHIQKIHFKDGDLVQRGQLLFELDPRPFQVAMDQASAQRQALEAQKTAAEKDVARYRELVSSGGATRQQLEKAEADTAAFDAQIAAKVQEVRQHELDLEFSRITAPISGRIGRAMLTEGNLVNAGGSDPLLTTIVAVHPMHVYFSVDERTLQRRARPEPAESSGERVTLRERKMPFRFGLDSETGYPHEGILDFADNRVDPTTGTIELRGVVDNQDGRFVSGSRVRIRVPVGEPYSAVVVPDLAILSDQGNRYLLVVGDDNIVSRRDINLGRLLDDGTRVVLPDTGGTAAVTPDESIVVLGLQRARVNYPVEPVVASGDSVGQTQTNRGEQAGA